MVADEQEIAIGGKVIGTPLDKFPQRSGIAHGHLPASLAVPPVLHRHVLEGHHAGRHEEAVGNLPAAEAGIAVDPVELNHQVDPIVTADALFGELVKGVGEIVVHVGVVTVQVAEDRPGLLRLEGQGDSIFLDFDPVALAHGKTVPAVADLPQTGPVHVTRATHPARLSGLLKFLGDAVARGCDSGPGNFYGEGVPDLVPPLLRFHGKGRGYGSSREGDAGSRRQVHLAPLAGIEIRHRHISI